MKLYRVFIFSIFITLYFIYLYPVIKGSELDVSVEPFVTFPSIDTNNTLLGFGWFKNGFALEDVNTTCTFNSVYPVSGTVDLNGGMVYLLQDLIFKNVTTLQGWGTIVGENHAINFCSSIKQLPQNADVIENVSLFLSGNLTVDSVITFKGTCVLDGSGHTITLGQNGRFVVADGATLFLNNVKVEGISGTKIACLTSTSLLILDNVVWVQEGATTFSNGSISFVDTVEFVGSSTFSYESTQASTIKSKSTWFIKDNLVLLIGRQAGGQEPIFCENSDSVLDLHNCTFCVNAGGMTFTDGSISCSGEVTVDILSTDVAKAFAIGNGIATNDPILELNSGTLVTFKKGHVVWDIIDDSKVRFLSKDARIVRFAESVFHIKHNLTMRNVTIDSSSLAATILENGAEMHYDGVVFAISVGTIEVTGQRYNSVTNLLAGNDSIFLVNGILPMYTVVTGVGNTINGNGSITGAIILLDPLAELILGIDGSMSEDVTLNTGMLKLAAGLKFDSNKHVIDSGTVDIGGYSLMLGPLDTTSLGNITWQGTGGSVILQSQVSLLGTWVFSGNCILQGNGNVLDLSGGGSIVVADGATLVLRDIQVLGVEQDSITCGGNGSVLKLDNVHWVQNGDVIFDKGSLLFINDVAFVGSHILSYESSQTSTIKHNSRWSITDHMQLKIGRNNGSEPLFFEDGTSTLFLDNCSFHINSEGMQITNGRVMFARDVSVDIDSTDTTQCLIVGDGDVIHDMIFEFNPGASVNFNSGHIVYDVVTDGNIISRSTTTKMNRTAANTMHMKQNIILSNLTLNISPYAVTTFEIGSDLSYQNCIIMLPTGVISFTGKRYNAITNLLKGNETIFLSTGQLIIHTLVQGKGNNLYGNGLIAAPIILIDSDAELTISVDGVVSEDITLNGGKVILGQDIHFTSEKQFKGNGIVKVGGNQLSFGSKDADWVDEIYFYGDGANIDLNADVALSNKLTFSGNIVLNANGNTLDLTGGGELVVAKGSTLRLKNITINGISNSNVRCFDDTSTLILNDVFWVQNANYTFSFGLMQLHHDTIMSGSDTVFVYQTSQPISIFSRSHLLLDENFTFKYDPSSGDQNLLNLEDSTSHIILDGATFHVTGTGINLKNGSFLIKSDSLFVADDSVSGITLGTGQIGEDCTIHIAAGSILKISNGVLNYKNVAQNALVMGNSLAALYMMDNTTLRLYENLIADNGTVRFGHNTVVLRNLGKTILGDVITEGELTFGSF